MRGHAALTLVLLVVGCGRGCGGGSSAPAADAGEPCGEPAEHAGEGTYYDADGSGNCSFDPSPGDLMVAAMNQADYDGSAVCGACIEVDGPNGTVTVRIVDSCPGCAFGDVDLSQQAFERIAPLSAGRVPISWRYLGCDVEGPLRYRFKDGSNPFWTALQIRNHRHAIASLEARSGDGSWRNLAREPYNYFVADNLGDGPFTVRVTDVHGHVVEDSGIPLGDATESAGTGQLAACPQ